MESPDYYEWEGCSPEEAKDRDIVHDEMSHEDGYHNQQHYLEEVERRVAERKHQRQLKTLKQQHAALVDKYRKQLLDSSVHGDVDRAITRLLVLCELKWYNVTRIFLDYELYKEDKFLKQVEVWTDFKNVYRENKHDDMWDIDDPDVKLGEALLTYDKLVEKHMNLILHPSVHDRKMLAIKTLNVLHDMAKFNRWHECKHYLESVFEAELTRRLDLIQIKRSVDGQTLSQQDDCFE